MTVAAALAVTIARARRRHAAIDVAVAAPLIAGAAALAWRIGGAMPAWAVVGVGVLALAVVAHRRRHRLDAAWAAGARARGTARAQTARQRVRRCCQRRARWQAAPGTGRCRSGNRE